MTAAEDNTPTSKLIAIVVGLVAGTALIVHARSYPILTYDDAFISLRYAQRLLEGHGLTWTDGPPVEGYSNLLWILGCALLGALGVDLVDTPVVLGVISALATIAALVYAFPPRTWTDSLPAFAGGMFVALSGPIGLWAVSGLEGCMVGALLAWSVVLLRPLAEGRADGWKDIVAPGVPLALLCLTRPDGPLVVLAVCAFLLVRARSRDAVVGAIAVGVLPGVVTAAQVAFRLAYYGDWLPNTARAKVAFTAARVDDGLDCVAAAGGSSYALWVPALLALFVAFRDEARRPRILLELTLLGVWVAYAASITCQIYGYRMLIICYVLLAFLVAEVLDWAMWRGGPIKTAAWVATLALLLAFGRAQQDDKNIAMAHWRKPPVSVMAATIGNTLRDAFADEDPLVAVDAAGAIPFYSGLRSIDMLGLNDAHIARHHDEEFGHGVQGHELGDGAYVLSREPDVIVAGVLGASRPAFRGGKQMEADARFHEQYRRVRVRGETPHPTAFNIFCRLDGRVGLEREPGLVTIPGYFFASEKDAQAQLDAGGAFGTRYLNQAHGRLEGVALGAGTWRVVAHGAGRFQTSARRQSDGSAGSTKSGGVEITLGDADLIDIGVVGNGGDLLTAVVIERIRD